MNNEQPHLSVIIPAFNEERRLSVTLNAVIAYLNRQSYAWEIIVADDGSRDRTVNVVREQARIGAPIRLITHPDGQNHGKGAAVRLGMLAARGKFRLFMDADNSTSIDHLEKCWPLFDDGYDAVIGSRTIKGARVVVHQARWKEALGKLGNIFIQLMAAPGITDTQAGFKIFRSGLVEDAFPRLTINGWGFDVELLAVVRFLEYRLAEMPITWINSAESKVRLTAYPRVLMEVIRTRWNLATGAYGRRRRHRQ